MVDRLEMRFEWADGAGMRDAALACTMARLEIRVGNACVTLAYDRANRSAVEGAYISLLPLATWAVDCWWFAWYEGPRSSWVRSLRQAASAAEARWHRRHGWLAFREGFALPQVVFSSAADDVVRVDWFADRSEAGSMPLAFLSQGSALVAREQAQTELSRIVEAVLARCDGMQDVRLTELRDRWEIIRSASPSEAVICQRAALLGFDGLDSDEVDDELAALLEAPQVETTVFEELLDVVDDPSPARLADQATRFGRLLDRARGAPDYSRATGSWSAARECVGGATWRLAVSTRLCPRAGAPTGRA